MKTPKFNTTRLFVAVTVSSALLLPAIARAQDPPPVPPAPKTTKIPAPEKLMPAPAGFDTARDAIKKGTVTTVEYDSSTVGAKRKMLVYTPPGYNPDTKYPVLYLLHGLGDDETGWKMKGSADTILDNLYADNKLVPMIVVMPNGRAGGKNTDSFPEQFKNFANFENDLLKDVIPYIDSHYKTQADRTHRALAGLSMGGGQSLDFGLTHLDTFSYVGGFSSAPNTKPAVKLIPNAADTSSKLKLLWISCGDRDGLMDISDTFHLYLDSKQIKHIFHIDSGGHEWPVWKNDLYLISQKLFR